MLPLLFSFCFVFSGFLSVNAYAYEYYNNIPVKSPLTAILTTSSGSSSSFTVSADSSNIFTFNNGVKTDIVSFGLGTGHPYTILPVNVDLYDYYLVASLYSYNEAEWTFFPDTFKLSVFEDDRDWSAAYNIPVSDLRFYDAFAHQGQGFAISCKVDFTDSVVPYFFEFSNSTGSGSQVTNGVKFQASFIEVPKDNSEAATNAIIGAINNQTNSLNGSIGQAADDIQNSVDQAADDIQQSIEDQYSGEPMEEILGPLDDVTSHYNESIGVFDYSGDLIERFVTLFIDFDTSTPPVLTFPGFSIDVGGESYVIWPDYSYNLREIESAFPLLINAMRMFFQICLWFLVLNYSMSVFRRRFMSNGG